MDIIEVLNKWKMAYEPYDYKVVRDIEQEYFKYVTSTGYIKLRDNARKLLKDYPDCEIGIYEIDVGKTYKIYDVNMDSTRVCIKQSSGYSYIPVVRVYISELFLCEPVAAPDGLTEYQKLIEQANEFLKNSGVEMLSTDVEATIDWDSSSLYC